ncbi:MAG: DUF1566 domain-containing protein, partial [Spirochaetia bacterium]|nr:DUF1566 domain-containing protein [Spirochaetia bacterium]
CGTRNGQDAVECRLCSVGMDQQELCSKEHIEQSDALYQAHLEQVRKEREERERLEREREEQIRLERERIRKIKQRRRTVILVMIAALITLGGLIWSFILKPMYEYKAAQEYYEAGMYDKAYQTFEQLGDYKDARNKAAGLTRKVSFDSQGGSEPGARSKYVVYGQNYGTLPTVTRNGYGFDGWWTEPNGRGQEILSTTTAAITGDQTLYAKWGDLGVGDIGPAGGYIFYDKGNYSDGWRYLEAAPAGNEWSSKVWGGYGTEVGGTGTAVGTGASNTEKIVAKFGNAEPYGKKTDYAAKLCADLVVTKDGVVYDDWFLPSKNELDLIFQNLYGNNLGGFSEDNYWSSSVYSANSAWLQHFGRGTQYYYSRLLADRVRPVRAF